MTGSVPPIIQGFNILQWCSFAPHLGVRLSYFPGLDYKPRRPQPGPASSGPIPAAASHRGKPFCKMLESKDHWQIPVSGGFCTDIDLAIDGLTSNPIRRLQIIAIPPFT
jgi:hypothetical protein